MDPIGFALENFDRTGRWRTSSTTGCRWMRAASCAMARRWMDRQALRDWLVGHPDVFATNVAQKLLIYALGRGVDHHDMPTVRHIVRAAAADDYRFASLIMASCRANHSSIATRVRHLPRRLPRSRRRAAEGASMYFLTRKHLSRRTLLRGAGATLALPLLESMTPAMAASAAPAPRFASIYVPHGVTIAQVDARRGRQGFRDVARSCSRSSPIAATSM